MSDEQPIWERMNGETNLWYDRFCLYLSMGPSRSLLGTVNEEAQKSAKKRSSSVPGAWYDASNQWDWKARAEAWDEHRRRYTFTSGNAYDVTRIEKLNRYSERLEREIDKMLDAMPAQIKKPWFNQFLYEKYLQTLEAIASETGGRVKTVKQEVTGKDGAPLQVVLCLPDNGDDEPLSDEHSEEDVS
jgi:hypothetical protein